jgi:hypothetical protein
MKSTNHNEIINAKNVKMVQNAIEIEIRREPGKPGKAPLLLVCPIVTAALNRSWRHYL